MNIGKTQYTLLVTFNYVMSVNMVPQASAIFKKSFVMWNYRRINQVLTIQYEFGYLNKIGLKLIKATIERQHKAKSVSRNFRSILGTESF